MTPEQLAKLPVWAQREFTLIERSRAALELELRQFQGADDSPITMRRHSSLDYYPVPNAVVRFRLGLHHTIDIRIDGDALDVNGDGRSVQIQPWAANHFRVTVGGS